MCFIQDSFVNLVHITMVKMKRKVPSKIHCFCFLGNYIKDLSRLGRDLHQVIIIDNSPVSYIFHQDNAVRVFDFS